MKNIVIVLAVAVATLSASSSFARNVWRECGIGGMLFKQTGWAAITSNIIWDWGTTATSSNVSSDDLCEGPKASTAQFINDNYANLEEETATGTGEHTAAMLNNLGCEQEKHNDIISSVRADLQKTVANPEYAEKKQTEKAEQYYTSVISTIENKYAQSCNNIQ